MENIIQKKFLDEISKYSPFTEKLTLSTLMAINQGMHILNIGKAGIGKTRNTEELLNLLKIPHSLVAGHISPKAFFEILKKDGIIVVDEGATLLSDATITNLLLNALWNGKVEWRNNREELSHNFKGTIIFNTNKINNNEIMEALTDRIFTNKIDLNSEQIKSKIISGKDYKPNMKVWAEIKERINKKSELSEPVIEKLYHLVENGENKSVREIWRLKKIASFSLSLLGNLSLIDYFKETDEIWKIINSEIKRSDKIKKISELKCITERGARKVVAKYEMKKGKNNGI